MKDFQGTEIQLNDRVYIAWSLNKQAIGQVRGFVDDDSIEVDRWEATTHPIINNRWDPKSVSWKPGLLLKSHQCIVLNSKRIAP
jgi:hypothetical protein